MRWPSPPSTHKTTTGETRSLRRFVHSFHSTGSYGLVMLMIVATYVLATTLTQQWGATIVLVAQIGTVWLALRTSLARRRLRAVAAVLFTAAIVAAAANLLVERDSDLVAFVFLTASALYVVAPVSIVRHIGIAERSIRRPCWARCAPTCCSAWPSRSRIGP